MSTAPAGPAPGAGAKSLGTTIAEAVEAANAVSKQARKPTVVQAAGGVPAVRSAGSPGHTAAAVRRPAARRRRSRLPALLIVLLLLGGAGYAGWRWAPPPLRKQLLGLPLVQTVLSRMGINARPSPAGAAGSGTPELEAGLARTRALETELAARTKAVAEEAAAVSKQAALLRAREAAIKEQEASLNLQVKQAQERAAAAQETRDREARLLQVYEHMRPRDMVRTLSSLTDDQALWMLERIDPEATAQVLALLEPARAARLTQRMMP